MGTLRRMNAVLEMEYRCPCYCDDRNVTLNERKILFHGDETFLPSPCYYIPFTEGTVVEMPPILLELRPQQAGCLQ